MAATVVLTLLLRSALGVQMQVTSGGDVNLANVSYANGLLVTLQQDQFHVGSTVHLPADAYPQSPWDFHENGWEAPGWKIPEYGEWLHRQVPTSSKDGSKILFRQVSTTLICVMCMTLVSLSVYTVLAISRNVDELNGLLEPSNPTDILSAASKSIAYPLVVCCLFVGCRMHVLANTDGYGEPQNWVKACMIGTTSGIIIEFVVVLLMGTLHAGNSQQPFSEVTAATHCDVHPHIESQEFVLPELKILFSLMEFIGMTLIYAGVAGVIVGIFVYKPADGALELSAWSTPSLMATILLNVVYMSIHLGIWAAHRFKERTVAYQANDGLHHYMSKVLPKVHALQRACVSAGVEARKIPMLTVLFTLARLHAANLDPWLGRPQQWARMMFYGSSVACLLEIACGGAIGATGKNEKGYYGVHIFRSKWQIHAVKKVVSICLYSATIVVLVSIARLKQPSGEHRDMAPAVQCSLFLVAVYVGVQIAISTVFFLKHVCGKDFSMLCNTVVAAGVSVGFYPMASILFIATRMRAIQITDNKGNPQCWAQDAMYLCVFGLIVQAICCLVLPIFTGLATSADENGNARYDLAPMVGAYAVTILKYFVLFCVFGGMCGISFSVFLITPYNANYGHGRSVTSRLVQSAGVVLIALLVAALLSSAKVIGLAIKFAIESVSDIALGASVTVDKAVLSVCHGYVRVCGVTMDSPVNEGVAFKWPHMLKVKSVLVKLDLWKLMTSRGKHVVLHAVVLEGVELAVEKLSFSTKSNMKLFLDNVKHNQEGALDAQQSISTADKKALEQRNDKNEAAPESCCLPARALLMRKKSEESSTTLRPKTNEDKKKKDLNLEIHTLDVKDIRATLVLHGKPVLCVLLADMLHDDLQEELKHGAASELVLLIIRTLLATAMGNAELWKEAFRKMKTKAGKWAHTTDVEGVLAHAMEHVKHGEQASDSDSESDSEEQ